MGVPVPGGLSCGPAHLILPFQPNLPALCSPQELLEFSLVHQAQWAADGDLFDEPGEEGEGGVALGPHAELAAEGGGAEGVAAAPTCT